MFWLMHHDKCTSGMAFADLQSRADRRPDGRQTLTSLLFLLLQISQIC